MIIGTWLIATLAATALADMPPTEFLSARITVKPGTMVTRSDLTGKMKKVSVPKTAMNVYIWRERGDAPVVVTSTTPAGALGSRGNTADFGFSLVEDTFAISQPQEAVIVSGASEMIINTPDIVGVEPYKAPLDGHHAYLILPVATEQAKLLRKSPPLFFCNLGHDRFVLSWNKKYGRIYFQKLCTEDAGKEPPSKEQMDSFSKLKGVMALSFAGDELQSNHTQEPPVAQRKSLKRSSGRLIAAAAQRWR